MKAYTDLSQSKKLAEILPLDSADMCYFNDGTATKIDANPYTVCYSMWKNCVVKIIPCWSLAALLDVLPKEYYPIKDHETVLILGKPKDKWCVLYWDTTGMQHGEETLGDNLIDACVEMIIKLKERNLL